MYTNLIFTNIMKGKTIQPDNSTYILLVGWIEKLIRVANPTNPKYMSWVENVSQPNLTKPVYTPTHFLDLIRVTFF